MNDRYSKIIREAFLPEFFKTTSLQLNDLEKDCCFSSFGRSTQYVMEKLAEAGFSNIERIPVKADGVNESFDAVVPQAWDRTGRCFLEVADEVPELPKILADTDETGFAISVWAGATSPDGSVGKVVMYDPENLKSMRGKWVFFDSMPRGAVSIPLVNAGALGVITTDFKQGVEDPDATRWLNGTGTYGWYYVKNEPHIPMFCLTARRAAALKKLIGEGREITLRGVINTRIYDGEIYTVTATIPGEEEEEFALIGHLYEPFLNDNAVGVAAAIEMGRLIKSSKIKLRKTLRVIFSMEHYGLAHYYKEHLNSHRMFAALNIDCLIGYTYRELGDELHFRLSPPTVPFAGDLLLEQLLRDSGMRWQSGFGNLSDDTIGGDPEIGVPTNWIYSKTHIFHHTSGRMFADVDWEVSNELFILLAVYTLFVLSADVEELRAVIPQLEKLACDRFQADDTPFARKVKCDFVAGQLRSLNKICSGAVSEEYISQVVAKYSAGGGELVPQNEVEKTASEMVVTRCQPGTPWSLAKIPLSEKRSFLYAPMPLHFALFDGKRSVLEAVRIYDVFNNGNIAEEKLKSMLEYLAYLEKYGYLQIKKVR